MAAHSWKALEEQLIVEILEEKYELPACTLLTGFSGSEAVRHKLLLIKRRALLAKLNDCFTPQR